MSSEFRYFIHYNISVFTLFNVFSKFMNGGMSIFQNHTCGKYQTAAMFSETAPAKYKCQ